MIIGVSMKIKQYFVNAIAHYDGTQHRFALYFDSKVKASNREQKYEYFDNISGAILNRFCFI